MPYTLAHPAVVVPLRRWAVLGAAVAGAMAPDVGYYLPARVTDGWFPSTDLTHSWLGAFTVDAALGLVLYLVWRWPVRPGLLGSLPEPWRCAALGTTARVLPGRGAVGRVLLLYVSVVLGALSHVLLDVLTHDRPETPAVLVDETVLGLPIAGALQRGLSVVGLVLIGWWLWRWARDVAPVSSARPTPALAGVLASVLGGSLVVGVLHLTTTQDDGAADRFVQALVGLTSGAALGLLLATLVLAVRGSEAPSTSPVSGVEMGRHRD